MTFKRKYLNAVFGSSLMGATVGGTIGLVQDSIELYKTRRSSIVEYIPATRYTPAITSNNPNLDKGIVNGATIGGSVGLIALVLASLCPPSILNEHTRFKKD